MISPSALYRRIPVHARVQHTRAYAAPTPTPTPRSGHAEFYASMLPGMIPVALLGSAVYLGLQLIQGKLAHEQSLDEATERIRELQVEVDRLQRQRPPTITPTSTAKSTAQAKTGSWWPWS
ncbi:hypothetical protein PAXRUDRAFT_821735 [Paxillus rubicundulus Ve08.2h10]|uniref:Uncharacterized protein n=1 Tax=Paxillus rubicundulus Ve08.2h10 TaxID=930991 RepID=A0A0D0DNC3_9AGAM|nr:hypothetical protein PAXRUDRAFT_821735 [Paxillus rubicundulus Ve08.2h10]